LYVYPVGGLTWNMTAQAVLFEAGCDLLIGRIGFEKCPSPSITPQRVIREPILGVLDHHELHYGLIRSPTCVACRHLGVIGRERFFFRRKCSRHSRCTAKHDLEVHTKVSLLR
jgi:hypothetical protein